MTNTIQGYQDGDTIYVIYPEDFPNLSLEQVESSIYRGVLEEDDMVLLQLADGRLVVVQSIDLEDKK